MKLERLSRGRLWISSGECLGGVSKDCHGGVSRGSVSGEFLGGVSRANVSGVCLGGVSWGSFSGEFLGGVSQISKRFSNTNFGTVCNNEFRNEFQEQKSNRFSKQIQTQFQQMASNDFRKAGTHQSELHRKLMPSASEHYPRLHSHLRCWYDIDISAARCVTKTKSPLSGIMLAWFWRHHFGVTLAHVPFVLTGRVAVPATVSTVSPRPAIASHSQQPNSPTTE